MIRTAAHVLLLAGAAAWIWLALSAETPTPGARNALAPGAFASVLGLVALMALAVGLPLADLLRALAAGLSATALSGPALALLPPATGYATAAAVGAVVLWPVNRHPLAPILAAGAQLCSLVTLARLQLGFGGSLIEIRPELILPAAGLWALAGLARTILRRS